MLLHCNVVSHWLQACTKYCLVQDWSLSIAYTQNSSLAFGHFSAEFIANTLEMPQSCTKPVKCQVVGAATWFPQSHTHTHTHTSLDNGCKTLVMHWDTQKSSAEEMQWGTYEKCFSWTWGKNLWLELQVTGNESQPTHFCQWMYSVKKFKYSFFSPYWYSKWEVCQ